MRDALEAVRVGGVVFNEVGAVAVAVAVAAVAGGAVMGVLPLPIVLA